MHTKPPKVLIVVASLIVLVGLGWLLSGLGLMPEVNWIWVGGLTVSGLLVVALGGIDRMTLTVGPFLLAAAIGSFLRQSGSLDAKIELPALVLVFGMLMLLNLVLPVKNPEWMRTDGGTKPGAR
ncbi:MAG: hypothetical protein AB7Q00_06045 [Phycisphaerales bacterium]|nr:MAG: hypothetical protein IPK69_10720 [Phycisphaerales bacterium]